MKLIVVLLACLSIVSIAHSQEFRAKGKGYEYGFSEIKGWVGIGQELENFPQDGLVFDAAERKGEDVNIVHLYTDLYMFSNVTTGAADEFWKKLETRYRKGSLRLKVERANDINISGGLSAKVICFFNIGDENKSQAIASIPNSGRIVSLVMQASSEKLLREHLVEFARLVRTYKASGPGQ